jgi:DNA-binding response OmpR family regulator
MSRKILIVDDEPNIVMSLEFLLRREGFDVAVAADGDEVAAQMSANRPDLVLLDVMMPRKNGYDVCREIRANPSCDGVKVVMLTAKGRDTEVSKGMALGADAYVTKPFSTKELAAMVHQLLGDK